MKERESLFELSTTDPVELHLLTLKSKLSAIIGQHRSSQGWSQKQLAEHLNITQPRVSNMLQARLNKFSLDFLLGVLIKLGYKMNVEYDPTNLINPIQISIQKD